MRRQPLVLAGVTATALLVCAAGRVPLDPAMLPDMSPTVLHAAARQASPAQATPGPARPAPATAPATPSASSAATVMSRYCVTCHNPRTKSGGLELDASQLA